METVGRDGRGVTTNGHEYARMNESFDLEKLREIKAKMPKPYRWWWAVAKPEYVERLKNETKLIGHLGHTLALGIDVFAKVQTADCWMFSHRGTLSAYMNGELTELNLAEIALFGKCLSQSFGGRE